MNLRTIRPAPRTPLWITVLPLAFVAVVAYGVATGAPWDRDPSPRDASSQIRPN